MTTRTMAFRILFLFAFLACTRAQAGSQWIFNEILADPGRANDSNNNGNFDSIEDEFLELVNLSGEDVDISGWTISDLVRIRHIFPEGSLVADGCAVVVFGGGPLGPSASGTLRLAASSGTLALNNSGDTLTLSTNAGIDIVTATYGPEGNNDQSLTLDPDLDGAWTQHAEAGAAGGTAMSPGTLTDGTFFEGCTQGQPEPPASGWVINELHPSPEQDANGDGTVEDDTDEFIEVVNLTGVEQDISNWALADGATVRHLFLPGTIVADNCAVVVFGGGGADLPESGALIQAASSGTLDLDDNGDTVSFSNEAGETLALVTYSGADAAGQSLVRSPELEGDFLPHSEADGSGGESFSPGTLLDGVRFQGCPEIAGVPDSIEIWEIQGPGMSSPLEGENVLTRDNVVTGVIWNGFFLQTPDERSDGDPETSDGIFVYTDAPPDVQAGDLVDVVGTVQEFFGWTELSNPRVTTTLAGQELPDPVIFDDTQPSHRRPQPENELERFENMLVEFSGGMVVNPLDRYGNCLVVADERRPYREPGLLFPGQPGLLTWDGNPEIFEVDPDAMGLENVDPAPGTVIKFCRGPLAFRYGRYRLHPEVFELDDNTEAVPVRSRNPGELAIATLNLYQFMDSIDDPLLEEVILDAGEEENRLAKHSLLIREILGKPDILCVQEAENLAVLQNLADRILLDDDTALYTPYLETGSDPGGRNNGLLVRDTVEVESAGSLGFEATFRFGGRDLQTFSRPPQVLTCYYLGSDEPFPLTVLNLHLRSLLNIEDPSQGNFVRRKRLAQARFVAQAVQSLQEETPDIHLVVAGDFNAFEFTDGYVDVLGIITGLEEEGSALLPGEFAVEPALRNHVLDLDPLERYSTVNLGNSQAVDHILTSSALDKKTRGAQYGRSNADAPTGRDNDPTTALGASDHDGLVLFIETENAAAGPTPFVRGDFDTDGALSITDAIALLNFLFLGNPDSSCSQAGDANRDGGVDITDGISLLGFLFLGQEGPPAPFPACGIDPETSDCSGYPPCG